MKEINNNTYLVLAIMRDKENNLGMCKARGMTKSDLISKSGLSESTVKRAIDILIACGYIKEAVKQVNKKAYYVCEEGIREMQEANKIICKG